MTGTKRAVLLCVAVVVAVAAQVTGLYGWSAAVAGSGVQVMAGAGTSCMHVDLPPEVPREGLETRRFEGGWSWAPPGLTCRTEIDGRSTVVHEPEWSTMAGPLAALLAGIAATTGAVAAGQRAMAPDRPRRFRAVVTALSTVLQPITLVVCATAVILPGAV
ncbi:hypothetical protein ACFOVU_22325 [Nocardiopsis sediminis]|uniref:Uncharacterized protein n=1 Tax=Nocardiopsis sediminis TaxID=1778267 RepID=A0ABV8FTU6_9ACTN